MSKSDICKNLKFSDCELAILRHAVDTAEEKQGKMIANSPEVKRIIGIVENFIRQKKLICYGGTAINNILPKQDQFYNTDIEIPDYDFYSSNALANAKELVDLYIKEGFVEVEAKSGQHYGTYKVFVNFIPVADISSLPKELFNAIKKEAIKVAGILYAPPNLLRMGMYLELSRPDGDVSRWEKVLKRLTLLNRNYPLTAQQCSHVDFQRKLANVNAVGTGSKHHIKDTSSDTSSNTSSDSDSDTSSDSDSDTGESINSIIKSSNKNDSKSSSTNKKNKKVNKSEIDKSEIYNSEKIYETVKTTLMDQGVVFFGGYAVSLYSQYMPKNLRKRLEKIPDFDVLSEEPLIVSQIVKERLNDIGLKNVKIIKRPAVGEIIAPHYEIRVGNDVVAFVYEPLACHSYNVIKEKGYEIKVATIDTMLSFYLAFLYANRPYYDKDRILCMSKYLFEVQEKNRLEQKGLLKRFSINCMGHQETVEEIRAEKTEKFAELKDKKGTPEYEEWFLRYRPLDTPSSSSSDKMQYNSKIQNNDKMQYNDKMQKGNTKKYINNKNINKKKTRKRKNKRKGLFFGY